MNTFVAFVVVGGVWVISGILTYLLVKDYDLSRYYYNDTKYNWSKSLSDPTRYYIAFMCLFGPYGTYVTIYVTFIFKFFQIILLRAFFKTIIYSLFLPLGSAIKSLFKKEGLKSFLHYIGWYRIELFFILGYICFQILKLVPFGVIILGLFPKFFHNFDDQEATWY